MDIHVTWITPRKYTATVDDAALLRLIAGTAAGHEARQLLTRLRDRTLDDAGLTRLGELIGDYPGLLDDDDDNWTAAGQSEVTHIEAAPSDLTGTEQRYVASWAEEKDHMGTAQPAPGSRCRSPQPRPSSPANYAATSSGGEAPEDPTRPSTTEHSGNSKQPPGR